MKKLVLYLFIFSVGLNTFAKAEIAKIFNNNMVLQREMQIPIWGWADAGETVTVKFAGQIRTAKTGKSGKWMLKLTPLKVNKIPQTMIVCGKDNKIVLKNILIGEVWLCAGQSNMARQVAWCALNSEQEIKQADYPEIRLIRITPVFSEKPLKNLRSSQWKKCTSETVGNFSSTAYFFGRCLYKELNVPIGLINTSLGGTKIEPWTPPCGFNSEPCLKKISDKVNRATIKTKLGRKAHKDYLFQLEKWIPKAKRALKDNKSLPKAPVVPSLGHSRHSPTRLFNGMISPIIPYAVKGAIWYQGESNGSDGMLYYYKQRALLYGLRKLWNQGDFPFYYVQLANYRKSNYKNAAGGDSWTEIREAQRCFLNFPNTGMAVAIDIGEAGDVHPKNKQDVGKRLALWALAKDYGKKNEYSGPLFKKLRIEGSKVIISFSHVESGLMIGKKDGLKNTVEDKENNLKWFSICDKDKKWYRANAKIVDNKVVVWNDRVKKPVAVRYAYASNPDGCNLYNKEGLPASPFRTDQ